MRDQVNLNHIQILYYTEFHAASKETSNGSGKIELVDGQFNE